MKLLLFADLHLDTPFAWADAEVARARRFGLRDALRRIMALAHEHRVDAVVCAGDLYEHDRFSPDTAEFLRVTFAEAGRPVFLAPGNHDWLGPQSLYAQVNWTDNVHLFTADRLTAVSLADGLTLWGAAHRAPANTDGFLDGFGVDRDGVHLGLFHGSERSEIGWQEEGKAAHAPFSADHIPRTGLHHALVGHFHSPRDAAWHTYPGNPDPLTFGESGDRGAVLVEVAADGGVTRTRHRVSVSQVTDVDVDISGVRHADEARERVAAAVATLRGIVRVTLSGEVSPEVDVRLRDLRGVAPQLEALVPRLGRVQVAYDFDSLLVEQTVRGQFVRDVSAADLDEGTRRRVLVTGLRALDGRSDELEVH